MTLTETYNSLLKNIEEETVTILQCNGVPGSGKSQIIRKIAEEFPFGKGSESDVVIKWHIQCKDSGHDVRFELTLLVERLLKSSFDVTQEKYHSVVDNLDMDEASQLVDTLISIQKPILIIVEDPQPKDKKLLKSLCCCLQSQSKTKLLSTKFHVYVTSRKTYADLCSRSPCYRNETVRGFTEQEAIEYLNGGLSDEKKAAARKIFRRFSGLPLGLQAAKGYCKIARIDYLEYFVLMEDVDYDIVTEEKKAIKEEYGGSVQHVFPAIVMPFLPGEETDIAAILSWKVLCCISYFHYDRIPRFALEQCCHFLREKKVKNPHLKNKVEIGTLITKLREHGLCTETDEGEITFHEVVINAFRLNQHSVVAKFNPLKKAMEILCSLVSKDMRKKEHCRKMYKLRRHLQSLLIHINKYEEIFEDENDSILLRALTSHLHETAAAIMLNESPLFWKESDEHFKKALEYLWPEAIKYVDKTTNQSEEKLARVIIEESKFKASRLPKDFTIKYASKLEVYFEEDELEFLYSKCASGNCFSDVKKLYKGKGCPEELIRKLQECGLFLADNEYRQIFYAERFAFILHSWSRLVLYSDPEEVEKIGEKCLWMSELSNSVSIECKNSCSVSLLSEHLSKTRGWVPILLKLKKPADELKTALKICEKALNDPTDDNMYENGMLTEVYGPSNDSTRTFLLRYIVRINARLHKNASSNVVAEADKRCQELRTLAEKHIKTISTCLMCLIYCAKYYAAKGEFDKALKCYKTYFNFEPTHKPRFNVQCWAIYNYARTIGEHRSCSSDHKDAVLEECKKLLIKKDVMNKSLKIRLKDRIRVLDAEFFVKPF